MRLAVLDPLSDPVATWAARELKCLAEQQAPQVPSLLAPCLLLAVERA